MFYSFEHILIPLIITEISLNHSTQGGDKVDIGWGGSYSGDMV